MIFGGTKFRFPEAAFVKEVLFLAAGSHNVQHELGASGQYSPDLGLSPFMHRIKTSKHSDLLIYD